MECHRRFTYRRAATKLINDNNSWIPHPRADVVCLPPCSSLKMVCSAPSSYNIMHVYVYVYVCAYLFTKYQSTQKMQTVSHATITFYVTITIGLIPCSTLSHCVCIENIQALRKMQCHGRFTYHRADPYTGRIPQMACSTPSNRDLMYVYVCMYVVVY